MRIEGYISEGVTKYGSFRYYIQKEKLSPKWRKITIEIEGDEPDLSRAYFLEGQKREQK